MDGYEESEIFDWSLNKQNGELKDLFLSEYLNTHHFTKFEAYADK